MGNCMKKQLAAKYDGGDWGSPEKKVISGDRRDDSRKGDSFGERTAAETTEVKIKISKKQLEELLGRTKVKGFTVKQMLAQLMSVSERFESHQRSWRPALQSIPE